MLKKLKKKKMQMIMKIWITLKKMIKTLNYLNHMTELVFVSLFQKFVENIYKRLSFLLNKR